MLSVRVPAESKTFHLDLKENPRGKFLRITEVSASMRSTVIIPASGISELVIGLQQCLAYLEEQAEES